MSRDPYSEGEFVSVYRDLVRFFEHHGCRDPGESAQEVLFRGFVRRDKITNPNDGGVRRYLFSIAKNVALELRKPKHTREQQLEHEDAARPPVALGTLDKMALRRELAWCAKQIGEPDWSTLVLYHQEKKDREALAATLGISLAALRVRVFRIRERFKTLRMKYRAGDIDGA